MSTAEYHAEQLATVRAQRDEWIRLFNRLDAAINHHKKARDRDGFMDEADEALYAARDRIITSATTHE